MKNLLTNHYRSLDAAIPIRSMIKDNSIPHAAEAPSSIDAAITMRFAVTELQNAKELHATASEIAAPKQKKDDFEALFEKEFQKENQ